MTGEFELKIDLFWIKIHIKHTPLGLQRKVEPHPKNVITSMIDELNDGKKVATKHNMETQSA